MAHAVTVVDVDAVPTAVVAATTTWPEFPSLWKPLLDEVWACLRAGGITSGCRNIMLYKDNVPNVEVGVMLDRPCPLTGRVVTSSLPAGRVARAVHYGSYAGLGAAHRAVTDFCEARSLPRTGVSWETYGPHHDDPAQVWTEITYQLA